MAQIHSHRDLIVWQKSIRLSALVTALTKLFPAEERFGLTAQIHRSSASVHANIAAGFRVSGSVLTDPEVKKLYLQTLR